MTLTNKLRWLRRDQRLILQQKVRVWLTGVSGHTTFEWRDVPIVDESVTEAETIPVILDSNELEKG